MNIAELKNKILASDTTALAQAITLVESQRLEDWDAAKELLSQLTPVSQKSKRLGFSGPPGVGKSSFIEQLGTQLVKRGETVAVLAIDPSSGKTGGSILGDKTRMEQLSRDPKAFVRPSPSRGHLGGVTSSMPAVILLCEAAGYQWILIESVGVGQSEVELSQMVDMFTLLSQPGSGDELQAIKKGILEYVDLILVNKADRDKKLVTTTIQQYLSSLKILGASTVAVKPCSALTGEGVETALELYDEFFQNYDYGKRSDFAKYWFQSLILSEFRKRVAFDPKLQKPIRDFEQQIVQGKLLPTEAVDALFHSLGLR